MSNRKDKAYNFEEAMGYLVTRTRSAMRNRLNRNFQEAGLDMKLENWILLVRLNVCSDLNQQALADFCGIDKTSISRSIDGMVERGLLQRTQSEETRREKLISLTAKGRAIYKRMVVVVEATQSEVLAGIKKEEIEICKSVLRRVTANATS